MKLKPYPQYIDSEVEWVGYIPGDWDSNKIKHITDVKISNVDKKGKINEPDVLLCNYTDVYNNEFITHELDFMKATASFEQIKKLSLKKGDVIITKDSETADDIAVPALVKENLDNVVCGYHLALIRPNDKIQGDYLFRLLESKQINDQFVVAANGVTRFGISTYPIKNSHLMIPPIKEQQKISSFLDKKTLEIDLTIEKDTQLIELLKEKRTALINHAVTKGLDPDAPMKDSGVEWIGEIPGGWKVNRLKFLVSKIGSGVTPKGGANVYVEDGIPLLRSQNIHFDGLRLDDLVYITEEINKGMLGSVVKNHDVLLNITGASIGRVTYVEKLDNANVNQHVCIIRPETVDYKFLSYYLTSRIGQDQIFSSQMGTSREGLNFEQISNFIILYPPKDEQQKISSYLDKNTSVINQAMLKIEENINLLEEYKKSLIHHVVTGKVDVREVDE
jgi:type I restriction enzyme S subunit